MLCCAISEDCVVCVCAVKKLWGAIVLCAKKGCAGTTLVSYHVDIGTVVSSLESAVEVRGYPVGKEL